MKLYETEHSFAFMDIGPIAPFHSLVIPKYHATKLHEIPDEYLIELLPIAKKIANAIGSSDYNILQNNGKAAHQAVDHVHGKYQSDINNAWPLFLIFFPSQFISFPNQVKIKA